MSSNTARRGRGDLAFGSHDPGYLVRRVTRLIEALG